MGDTEGLIMATIDATVKVEVIKLYIFFPIAIWRASGDLAVLTVFGIPVYRRIGDLVNILGFNRTRAHAS